jgi:hypothetical protein
VYVDLGHDGFVDTAEDILAVMRSCCCGFIVDFGWVCSLIIRRH